MTNSDAEHICKIIFGVHGVASALPGEIDLNFKIKVDNKNKYILKVSDTDFDSNYLKFQQELLQFIAAKNPELNAPKVILDKNDEYISFYTDANLKKRNVRLLTWIDGKSWNTINPKTKELQIELGNYCGKLSQTLSTFQHQYAQYTFDWDIAQSLWTKNELQLFNECESSLITYFQDRFESHFSSYSKLRKQIIHNDANDDNIMVSGDILNRKINAVIDYGDAIHTQTINDLAIICTYAIMDYPNPLEATLPIIKGYHETLPLLEQELFHLYNCIAMRLVISVTKSAINKAKEPNNEYLVRSEKSAWELLKKWKTLNPEFAYYSFRNACGFDSHPKGSEFKLWTKNEHLSLKKLFPSINKEKVQLLDLSVSGTWIGHEHEFNNLDLFQFKIDELQKQHPTKIIAGGYLEPRPIYTSSEYDRIGNFGAESRTRHLGIDFWLPQNTPVHALFNGEVIIAVNDVGDKEYGGLVILKHNENNIEFYTLYGHLSIDSALRHKKGKRIKKGEQIAVLGNYPENGNWAPHLHFQIMLSLLDYTDDFPGVGYHSEIDIWKSICPNPNLFFKISELNEKNINTNEVIHQYRKKHLGKGYSLQYDNPIQMVRGSGVFLIDQYGKKYLDTVNNVAHVGHEHPTIVKAGQHQMSVLNTNTRYLHPEINAFTKELLSTLPPELCVVHFVNSGSEANELALRMVKTITGEKDIIASEVGYHGNTNACVDISSYKFDGKGGKGVPKHTHIFPLPDVFRGKYKGENAAPLYVNEVKNLVAKIQRSGRNIGGFIVEPIISCGGQIPLPKGFLSASYEVVRNAGGLCISDEVQVGCGRLGKVFWGFELYDVIPDIVTIGKPLGNGHPLAAVVCTKEVAEKFANGMEYFNTFGGNPVSCAIGKSVLETVKNEKLQQNALEVGNYLKSELEILAKEFPIIGDVRGEGLFLGIELVDNHLNPLPNQTKFVANRMKDFGILMSTDGKDNNVLKIKPPLVFSKTNADYVLKYLKQVLEEDFMR